MKIAFFLGQFPVLSETFVIRQVTGLVEAGHDVTIVMGEWGDKALSHEKYRSLRLQDKVHPLRIDVGGKLSRATMIAGFALKSLFSRRGRTMLRAGVRAAATGCPAALMDIAAQSRFGKVGRFDAIIAHFGQVGVRAMYLQQAGLMDGPIATVFHGFDMSEHAVVKRNLGNFKRLFTQTAMALPISELWRDKLLSWGARPDRVSVLRMGVDLDRLVMQDSHRPMGKPLQVLSVARFTEKKGLEYAIGGVIAANAASSTPVHYSLIGSGVLDASLRATAAAAPAGQIDFLGKRAQHEVFEALGNADVFIIPSV
jgi:colanic acid/amylovoran biosynthesis glycosyltransferase